MLAIQLVYYASAESVHKSSQLQVRHATSVTTKLGVSNVEYQVCATTPSGNYYCAGDGICCTPGSPESTCCPADLPVCCAPMSPGSLCCPADHPVCFEEGCCVSGSTKVCGDKCCTSDSSCCLDVDNCCETADACCSSTECCSEESPCCRKEGETEGECCNQDSMACCGDSLYGCATPCSSQFETVPCDGVTAEKFAFQAVDVVCPNRLQTRKLYRATYPGQTCYGGGLMAKNPQATRSVSSHVGCGSRVGYTSQYISFSTSLDVVRTKYWPNASPGSRIVEVDLDRVPSDCKTFDLTLPMNRARWIDHNPWAKKYTSNDCEVLLSCISRVPCRTIEGPKSDKEIEFQGDPAEL